MISYCVHRLPLPDVFSLSLKSLTPEQCLPFLDCGCFSLTRNKQSYHSLDEIGFRELPREGKALGTFISLLFFELSIRYFSSSR